MLMQATTRKSSVNLSIVGGALAAGEPKSLTELFAGQVAETLEAGESLFFQGDDAMHVFEITSGALRTVRILSDGRRVITGFVFAGDVLGVGYGDTYLAAVEAIEPAVFRRLGRRRFEDAVERLPGLRPQLMERLSEQMAAAQDQLVLLARKNADERVASFLLSLARRRTDDGEIPSIVPLPMTRLDMADHLGLTIETVSRVMTRLSSKGIVISAGRHQIVIKRPGALLALAVVDGEEENFDSRAYA